MNQSIADELLENANVLLDAGVTTGNHPFHQFVISTSVDNIPEQRTVVLRQWVLKRRSIIFHTDIRSPKVEQLKSNNNCSVLFYSKPDKMQLRFKCTAHVHYKDRLSDYLYSQTSDSQRECYSYSKAPSIECLETTKEEWLHQSQAITEVDPYENFAACVCNFNELELLYLSYKGHTRVLYQWDKHGELSTKFLIA